MTPILEKVLLMLVGKACQWALPKVEKLIQDWISHLTQKFHDHASANKFEAEIKKDQTRDERQKSEDDFINS
jgi:hypothetical protein